MQGDTSPLGKSGPRRLPYFVRSVAHALIRAGHPKHQAIAIAIGQLENWAAGRGNVHPDTRARAAKAITEWRALNATHRTTHLSQELPVTTDLAHPAGSMPSGKFPITNHTQLRAAIHLHGRAKPESAQAVKAHITRRAKAIGGTHLLPPAWTKADS